MKLKFKTQAYQSAAVQAVVDCFKGQPPATTQAMSYRIDPGKARKGVEDLFADAGFKNADLALADTALLDNIQQVQRSQNLPVSGELVKTKVAKVNLDIEMETGTGKTYCYIKTIFELNKLYGWSKFIIVVPSIAIREGVAKSLEITAEHFLETYHKKARFFIYNSKQLHHLESFSSDAGINVMVINVQAFNATGKDARRIYDALDDFQSRKPIDVISANRPILILDEPQKMEGGKTLDSLVNFRPLMVLRYSATHKTTHNKIHRLDALDAYNQKLVKKIAVRGIAVKGLAGTAGYLYLQSIEISSKKPPEARVEFEQKLAGGNIKRIVRKLTKGDNLFVLSNELDQYRNGFVVSDINANTDTLSFANGVELMVGDATGDVNESVLRRIQIREAIKAHFDKEQALFQQGVKVLSLFFIDEVAKYRDYSSGDEKGEYARIFEEEYNQYLNEVLDLDETQYIKYLKGISANKTHSGYFSIDKKTRKLIDPEMGKKATEADDVDAYDLILKDKERLLSLSEPVRFIFSHSALREGWDNPNVFVICALKHSDNTVSRRQEVGRGLRLCVNQNGDRMDHPTTVHDVNVLTVVASESYKDFVAALQKDISESLSARPRVANEAFFTNKVLKTPTGDIVVTSQVAKQIYKYLLKHDYTDDSDHITGTYHEAKKNGSLTELPPELLPYAEQVFKLIDSVFRESQLPDIGDDRRHKKNPLNANFEKQEFKALWNRINHKAAYSVAFKSDELIRKAVDAINDKDTGLRVTPLQYIIQKGEQVDQVSADDLRNGEGFRVSETEVEHNKHSSHSSVKYDLIGKLAEGTQLIRRTVTEILKGFNVAVFAQFKTNPESFIAEAIRLINEQKATVIIEHLAYDPVEDKYDMDIFTSGQTKQDFIKAGDKLKRHIYDYALTDSNIEREFVKELDTSAEVVVYAKLPRGFLIPTPVGDYNPDWAITFKEGEVKHVYFVAETKGSMSSMVLNEIEKTKIKCARKFFDEINIKYAPENVKYDVVNSFGKLMEIVGKVSA
jgi:type III restriction enzyme